LRGKVLATSNKDILNNELNLASCDSQIHEGLTYYYYKIDANNKYLSLIKPDEMKIRNSNHQFLGGINVLKSLYFTKPLLYGL
jgi:hypothetical protein